MIDTRVSQVPGMLQESVLEQGEEDDVVGELPGPVFQKSMSNFSDRARDFSGGKGHRAVEKKRPGESEDSDFASEDDEEEDQVHDLNQGRRETNELFDQVIDSKDGVGRSQ